MNMFHFTNKNIDFAHKIDRASSPEDEYWKHMHPFNEIIYFISGNVTYTVENETKVLEPGDCICIKAGKFHFATVDKGVNYERYVLKFPDSAVPKIVIDKFKSLPVFSKPSFVNKRFFTTANDFIGDNNLTDEEKYVLTTCNISKFLIYMNPAEDISVQGKDDLVGMVSKYVEEHINDKITLTEIAAALNYSESYLISSFKKEMHCSIMQYIRSKKCIIAYKMIKDGEKPKDVAVALGYDEYSTFYRNYTQVLGFAPTDKTSEYKEPAGSY